MKEINRLQVVEQSQVGEARRLAASISQSAGFDETRVGHVSIVVTELATNLLKHAGGGELIFRTIQADDQPGIEILSLDKGPGIRNINDSLRDGFSTAGSPGTGLGAIQRLSSQFDIYSIPGQGVVAFSQIWRQPTPLLPPVRGSASELGVVCLPIHGEEQSGDAWAIHQTPGRVLILLADGLGHGHFAAEASGEAKVIFKKYAHHNPAQIITHMHAALRHTRGAAVAIAEVILSQRILRFAGVGNIAGRIISSDEIHSLVSYNGTVGLEARKIQEFTYPWPEGRMLIMNSDGLDTRWNLESFPGLRWRHPMLIAGMLFRNHQRQNDDSTVLVFKEARSTAWA